MLLTLVVIILISNLAVNDGSFIDKINDENDQLEPGKLYQSLFIFLL